MPNLGFTLFLTSSALIVFLFVMHIYNAIMQSMPTIPVQ